MTSASTTGTPLDLNRSEMVLFPDAIPPVNPTILIPPGLSPPVAKKQKNNIARRRADDARPELDSTDSADDLLLLP